MLFWLLDFKNRPWTEGGRGTGLCHPSPPRALPGSQLQDTSHPSPLFVPFRIFKDARKDKGQDDFLGNVVVRLKVSTVVPPLLQGTPREPVKPPGVRAGSQPWGSTGTARILSQNHRLMSGPSLCHSHSNTLTRCTSCIVKPVQNLPAP